MTHPEKIQYDSFGLITQDSAESSLPVLPMGDHTRGTFATDLGLVKTPGREYVRKVLESEISDEVIEEFKYFTNQLSRPEFSFLRSRIPETVIKDDERGRRFLQARVIVKDGRANMADLYTPGAFDPDQIDGPETLRDLALIVQQGLDLYKDSFNNPDTGLMPGVGLYPEVHNSKNYVNGKLAGDTKDKPYFVDIQQFLPLTPQQVEIAVEKSNMALDRTSYKRFGMDAEEVFRQNGFNTMLPSLEDRERSPRTVGKTRRLGEIALAV